MELKELMNNKQDFKNIFIGEFVEILSKAKVLSDEGSLYPLMIQGYILEVDEEFVYIGETPLEIKKAIKRKDIVYIEIINPSSLFDDILESLEIPENRNEEN